MHRIRDFLRLASIACLLFAACFHRAAADTPLPEKTDDIETLTQSQAENLLEREATFLKRGIPLSLNGLTSLSAEVAAVLAGHEGRLSMNGLQELSEEAATALEQHKGRLVLNGLTSLPARVARSLVVAQPGRSPTGLPVVGLELNGVKELSPEAAAAFSDYKHSVSLNGLQQISDEAAGELAKVGGLLSLDGLTTLSDKAAEALSGHAAGLSLEGLTSLSDGAATALANHRHDLYLMGVKHLTDKQAMALANHKGGDLQLTGLVTLTTQGAAYLARHKGAYFPNVKVTGPDSSAGFPKKDSPAAAAAAPKEEIVNSVGIKLQLIPAGTFEMGSNEGERNESPVHEVKITTPFYIGVTEVTNAQWRAVMGAEPPSKWKDDERPVEMVSWADATAFCQKLTELPKEREVGRVYRLPTEAEWEHACRAGTTTKWGSGNDEETLDDVASFTTNSDSQTYSVGQKRQNAWGLHDMHGNVWEWCSDWYGPYAPEAVADPTGPVGGSYKVSRGGSWNNAAELCRSAKRYSYHPSVRSDSLGFRVALNVPGATVPKLVETPSVVDLLGSTEEQMVKMLGPSSGREQVVTQKGNRLEILVFQGIYPDCEELAAVMGGGECTSVLLRLNNPDGTRLRIDEAMHVEIARKLKDFTGSGNWSRVDENLAKVWKGKDTVLFYRDREKGVEAHVNASDRSIIAISR